MTGTDDAGRSCITADGIPRHIIKLEGYPGVEIQQLWFADDPTALDRSGIESSSPAEVFYPPRGGSRFMKITYPCGFGAADPDADENVFARLLMHDTASVDYGVILAGELTLVMEDGSETILRSGDLVVQNGVRHGWRNVGGKPAVGLFILVGCGEKTESTKQSSSGE